MQYPGMHEESGPARLVLFPRLVGLETSGFGIWQD